MSQYAIISHKNCNDGTAAAYVFKQFHGFDIPDEDFFFLAHTGDEEIDLENLSFYRHLENKTHLFVLDFSLDLGHIEDLLASYPNLKIIEIDHHKTFMEREGSVSLTEDRIAYIQNTYRFKDGESRYQYCYDKTVCGSVLTYLYLNNKYEEYTQYRDNQYTADNYLDINVPRWLLYIQDRDIWKWVYPDSKAYCEAFFDNNADPFKFMNDRTIESEADKYIDRGETLLQRREVQVESLAKKVFKVSFTHQGKTYKGIAVNSNFCFTSEVCHYLLNEHDDVDFALAFEFSGEYWKCSLRSLGEFDTCMISALFGGGGHQAASGFRMDSFIELKDYFNF